MNIAERIEIIIKSHNLTNSAFADQLGVQRSNISHIISGRSKPGLDFLQKVLQNFPKVNAEWLITGQQKSHTEQPSDTQQLSIKLNVKDAQEENKMKKEEQSLTQSSTDSDLDYILLVYKDKSFTRLNPNEQ